MLIPKGIMPTLPDGFNGQLQLFNKELITMHGNTNFERNKRKDRMPYDITTSGKKPNKNWKRSDSKRSYSEV